MRRWDEGLVRWDEVTYRELWLWLLVGILMVLVGRMGRALAAPVSHEDASEVLTPYATCRELSGAHTWAPEGFRIIHLQCPEAP